MVINGEKINKMRTCLLPKYGENFAVAFKEEIRQKEEFGLDMDSWLNQTMGGERQRKSKRRD